MKIEKVGVDSPLKNRILRKYFRINTTARCISNDNNFFVVYLLLVREHAIRVHYNYYAYRINDEKIKI